MKRCFTQIHHTFPSLLFGLLFLPGFLSPQLVTQFISETVSIKASLIEHDVQLERSVPLIAPSPEPTPSVLKQSTTQQTATLVQSSHAVSSSPQDDLYEKYAQEYHLSTELLKHIAQCESGNNPQATNYIYAGLYQFAPATWESTRFAMGLDPNPHLRFDAEESIKTAAFKIANGGIGAWPHCGKTL